MLAKLLAICLSFSLWIVLGREQARLTERGARRLGLVVVILRGALLGVSLALFVATGLTQAAGRNQSDYFFPALALGMSMIGVTFGILTAVLGYIKR